MAVVIETPKLPKQKKRKVVTKKILLKKKCDEKKNEILNKIEVHDLNVKRIKSNVNKQINSVNLAIFFVKKKTCQVKVLSCLLVL